MGSYELISTTQQLIIIDVPYLFAFTFVPGSRGQILWTTSLYFKEKWSETFGVQQGGQPYKQDPRE